MEDAVSPFADMENRRRPAGSLRRGSRPAWWFWRPGRRLRHGRMELGCSWQGHGRMESGLFWQGRSRMRPGHFRQGHSQMQSERFRQGNSRIGPGRSLRQRHRTQPQPVYSQGKHHRTQQAPSSERHRPMPPRGFLCRLRLMPCCLPDLRAFGTTGPGI